MYIVLTILAVLALGANGQSWGGDCSTCQDGYCDQNENCDYGCTSGWYGMDCSSVCSAGCMYEQCDQMSGYCLHGCVNGTQGPFCEEDCETGCSDGWGGCLSMDQWCDWSEQCYMCSCQGLECVDWEQTGAATAVSALTPALLLLPTLLATHLMG